MKEFPGGGNTAKEQFFGYRLSSARMVIECAFGRLKGRFGALRRDMDINIDDLPQVIYACFVLHNFCEINKELLPQEYIDSGMKYERQFQPAVCTSTRQQNTEALNKQIRNAFVEYFD